MSLKPFLPSSSVVQHRFRFLFFAHASPFPSDCAAVAAAYHTCCDTTATTTAGTADGKQNSALACIVSATADMDSCMPVDAAAEAAKHARLHFVVFADVLPALPREKVLSRMRDTLLQLCGDGGGAEAQDTVGIACCLCCCRLVFGVQADAYSAFLSSCITAAASKGNLLPLLQAMLQLLPCERLLHLQVHQRVMAASVGGKYRHFSPQLHPPTHPFDTSLTLPAGITARSSPSSPAAASRTCSSSAAQTPSSSSPTTCSRWPPLAGCPLTSAATSTSSASAGGRPRLSPLCSRRRRTAAACPPHTPSSASCSSTAACCPPSRSASARTPLANLTALQWDDYLGRVRQLAQEQRQEQRQEQAALAPHGAGGGLTSAGLSILRSSHAQLHEMQVRCEV